jgi:hypothetical protein
VMIQAALAQVEGGVKGAVQIIARLTYRQRYDLKDARTPRRTVNLFKKQSVASVT